MGSAFYRFIYTALRGCGSVCVDVGSTLVGYSCMDSTAARPRGAWDYVQSVNVVDSRMS